MNDENSKKLLNFNKYSTAIIEAGILLVLFVVLSFVSIKLDLFEYIVEQLGSSQDIYEIDEIIIVSAFFSIIIAIFAIRRWLELNRLLQHRNVDDKLLKTTNLELVKKTQELELQQKRSEKLSHLANFLQVSRSKDEAFKFISEAASSLFNGSHGALFVTRDSRNQLSRVTAWGDRQHPDYFSPDDCWGLRLGKQFVACRKWETPLCTHTGEEKQCITVCVPLTAYGEILGLFHVRIPEGSEGQVGKEIPRSLVQTLTVFSEAVSLTISNLTLQEKLRELAIHDVLTGLYNRQYLKETFDREIHRAVRSSSQIAVVMLDLDHFKQFNDTFGHPAGDMLLMKVGKYLKNFFRIEDFCCRFGGEEFLVLLSDVNVDQLRERCESLRQGISDITVVFEDVPLGQITATLGVAVYPQDGETYSQLIGASDKALYRAKKEGRDRVCFAN
jgi:diguanylate cyclase (GGDEF)-like protein